jgi:hypothetical protein
MTDRRGTGNRGAHESSGRAARPLGRGRARMAAAALALALALACTASAQAAPGPTASTGGAKYISYGSAILDGTVNAHGRDTSYYFQYGPTRAYGGQTGIASAGASGANVGVAVPITGLQPLTTYHYRLVAVNERGTAFGGDETFQTTKIPLSLAILAAPNPVLYGQPLTVQGTLSGTDDGNRQVALQDNVFPFTGGFQNIGNVQLTNASGGFEFTILVDTISAQFRVVTTTNPPIISAVATANVAVRVSSHVGRGRRAGYARIYGTVSPAENGASVTVLRVVHGHGVTVAITTLHGAGASGSSFSTPVRSRHGIYRVLVNLPGAQVSTFGTPLLIG